MNNFLNLIAVFRYQEYEYQLLLPIENVKAHLQSAFDEKKHNLKGAFEEEYTFKITPNRQFNHIDNFERRNAYLKGELIEKDKK